jgi:hypothetical protein
VPVGQLPNNGTGLDVTFASLTVTWVKFTIDNAVGANIGLSEIEVFGTGSLNAGKADAMTAVAPPDSGSGACGATGMELILLLGLLALRRKGR